MLRRSGKGFAIANRMATTMGPFFDNEVRFVPAHKNLTKNADMLDQIESYKLNWNPITVEGYNENKNEVTMVFNCDITTENKMAEVLKYVVGRTIWCSYNFPPNAMIILSFDIRGQSIIISKKDRFELELLRLIDNLDIDNQIEVDFLR